MSPSISGGGGGFVSPMTTAGDIIIENATPAAARLAVGSGTQLLGVSAGLPAWVAAPVSATRYQQALTGRGFLCENFSVGQTNELATFGTQTVSYLSNLALLNNDVVTGVVLNVGTVGSGTVPTGFFVGLYTPAGVQLAVSNNLNSSAALTTLGMQAFPFSAQYTSGSNQAVYAAILENGAFGSTAVQFNMRAATSDQFMLYPYGANQAAVGYQTGQTTLPAPATISTNPGVGTHYPWAALY